MDFSDPLGDGPKMKQPKRNIFLKLVLIFLLIVTVGAGALFTFNANLFQGNIGNKPVEREITEGVIIGEDEQKNISAACELEIVKGGRVAAAARNILPGDSNLKLFTFALGSSKQVTVEEIAFTISDLKIVDGARIVERKAGVDEEIFGYTEANGRIILFEDGKLTIGPGPENNRNLTIEVDINSQAKIGKTFDLSLGNASDLVANCNGEPALVHGKGATFNLTSSQYTIGEAKDENMAR